MNESSSRLHALDRYTQFTELAFVVHRLLGRGLLLLTGLLITVVVLLLFTDNPGWLALLYISAGTLLSLAIWHGKGVGIPIIPVFALQHLITYGTPIVTRNETIVPYSPEFITQAGFEVCVFLSVMTVAWRLGMELFKTRPTYSYALRVFSEGDAHMRIRVGVGLIAIVTAYNVADSMRVIHSILEMLPGGTSSLVSAMIKATTMAGYFLVAMSIGSGETKGGVKGFFWCTFVANALIIASSFLLSSATNLVASVVIGLFWGSGRMPWRFLLITAGILSFLHLGKFEMRDRYWDVETESADTKLIDLPRHYGEWVDASYRNMLGSRKDEAASFKTLGEDTPSMLARVNNAQNLLFAINAVEGRAIPVLGGATYALIPPLLIPRVLWPEKPRAHEGQVTLNVHFERQNLSASYKTYIAWGLLPEAYGNFGPIWGAAILGLALGLLFARIETITACKPLLSLEGLVTFAVFIELSVSFEMVASVLTTALFQSVVIITMACMPFVHHAYVVRPADAEADSG
jgi:hypothetical protein